MSAPALFIGHGSPRNALFETRFSTKWSAIAGEFAKPRAILCISAHWETKGVLITRAPRPRTIHDFYRFPDDFYEVEYPAPGDPALAYRIEARLDAFGARADLDSWGLDHGAWTVLRWMYPQADVPVLQLSLDIRRSSAQHYAIGQALAGLRDEGVMLLGSGNIVHNLRVARPRADEVVPWAQRFDDLVLEKAAAGDHAALIGFTALPDAADAVPESEHFLPLLYILAAARPGEPPRIFNRAVLGSASMSCIGFGLPG